MEKDTEVLKVITVTGNWFDVAQRMNELDLADNVIAVSPLEGNYTQVIVRAPKWLIDSLVEAKRIF
jgi:hypothetical protein